MTGDRLEIFREKRVDAEGYDPDGKFWARVVNGDYRWRVKARNGRVIATSGEGYKRLRHCQDIAVRVTGLPLPEHVQL